MQHGAAGVARSRLHVGGGEGPLTLPLSEWRLFGTRLPTVPPA